MKNENKKKYLKTNIISFIVGTIIFGSIGVYAVVTFSSNDVTYDNRESGLTSTSVKGAIDELYAECIYVPTGGEAILENIAWNSINNTNWNRPAGLNTYLNGDYYNSLNSTAQSQIVEASYYAGAVTWNNNDMQDQINDEKTVTSKVKAALPTVSEYIRANSNKEQCGTFSLNNDNDSICLNSDWMYINDIWWTLSPYSGKSIWVFFFNSLGSVYSGDANITYYAARSTITLSSEVQITGGMGTKSDPYMLE